MSNVEPESTINRNGPANALAETGLRTTLTRLPSARRVGRLQQPEGHSELPGNEKRISLRTSLDSVQSVGHKRLVQPCPLFRADAKVPHSGLLTNPSFTANGTNLIAQAPLGSSYWGQIPIPHRLHHRGSLQHPTRWMEDLHPHWTFQIRPEMFRLRLLRQPFLSCPIFVS